LFASLLGDDPALVAHLLGLVARLLGHIASGFADSIAIQPIAPIVQCGRRGRRGRRGCDYPR
jgi:hypothetical protein